MCGIVFVTLRRILEILQLTVLFSFMVFNQVVALFLTKPRPRTGRVVLVGVAAAAVAAVLTAAAVAAVMAAAAGPVTPSSKKNALFLSIPKKHKYNYCI